MRNLVIAAALLSLLGCRGSDPIGPEFVERLSTFGGCGDVVFFAVDDNDRLMLTFRAEGVVEQASDAGEETVTVFELPTTGTALVLEQGTAISDATCDDVIENGGPQVSRSWAATAGTATVTVGPGPNGQVASADLLLEDVVLESRGQQITMERLEWTEILVGWFPG